MSSDRETLRALAAEDFERWPRCAHYVVAGHEIADAMRWARDSAPNHHPLVLALDALDSVHEAVALDPNHSFAGYQPSCEARVLMLYREAIAAEVAASCDVDLETHEFGRGK